MPPMSDGVDVRVTFTLHDDESGLDFTDALTYPFDEWSTLTDKQLEAAKQERFANWKAAIAQSPEPAPVDPVDPDTRRQQAADLAARAQELASQAAALAAGEDAAVSADGGG